MRMITETIKEANNTGAREEKLKYPMGNAALSKKDCATEDQKKECTKYPYRRVVGKLMYGIVNTLITMMYALNNQSMTTILDRGILSFSSIYSSIASIQSWID